MSSSGPTAHRLNCLTCRQRKVRCDRQYPCSSCTKAQRDCIFPSSGRVQRMEHRSQSLFPEVRKAKLSGRIQRLEGIVNALTSELENPVAPVGSSSAVLAPRLASLFDGCDTEMGYHDVGVTLSVGEGLSGSDDDSTSNHRRRLVAHSPKRKSHVVTSERRGTLYVSDRFWATLRQEIKLVREIFDELENNEADIDRSCTPSLLPSGRSASSNGSAFVFSNNWDKRGVTDRLEDLRPPASQILLMWRTFVDDAGPFLQVLHVPTVTKVMQKCEGRIEAMESSMEPLVFAISMAAVYPLTREEVMERFGRDKDELIARLRLGTEQALVQADFIVTPSLTVVQAFAIYLFMIQRDEPARYTWSLVGLLVRIAVSLGLHRDGSRFPNMSPFEVEMRRRLWWRVCLIEIRLYDNHAPWMNISERNFDTREPTNINDADLDPDMTTPPTPRDGFTDSTITLVSCEMWRLSQTMRSVVSNIGPDQQRSNSSIENKLSTLRSFREKISGWCFWQLGQPMHVALALMCRVHLNCWELIINHLRQPHAHVDSPNDESFTLALSILEDVSTFQTSAATQKWAWVQRGNLLWQPLAIVLTRLCLHPWDTGAEAAWRLAKRSLYLATEAVRADPLWQPLQRLLSRAHKHRLQELDLQDESSPNPSAESKSGSQIPPDSEQTGTLTPRNAMASTAAVRPLPQSNAVRTHRSRITTASLARHTQELCEGQSPELCADVMNETCRAAGQMGDAHVSAQTLGWQDWDEMVRTDELSILWGLGGL